MKLKNPEKWLISVCGLNCARCDMYEAGHGNDEMKNAIVKWFKEERNETVKPERIRCDGCRGQLDAHWSPDCQMMLCAKEKGFQYCFQCQDFPCASVNEFRSDGIPHHERTIANSERMKEIGLETWIAEQKRKGQCVFCP
jgi:hypothetical protein